MFYVIHGVKIGTLGVLIDWGTRDTLYTSESFDKYEINRVGVRINFSRWFPYTGYDRFHWHFSDIRDAKNIMAWLAGIENA